MWIKLLIALAHKERPIRIFKYIGTELQLPENDGMKQMEIVLHILCNAYGNPEGNGNYRVWADHSKLEIEFCDVSTSKLTGNIIS